MQLWSIFFQHTHRLPSDHMPYDADMNGERDTMNRLIRGLPAMILLHLLKVNFVRSCFFYMLQSLQIELNITHTVCLLLSTARKLNILYTKIPYFCNVNIAHILLYWNCDCMAILPDISFAFCSISTMTKAQWTSRLILWMVMRWIIVLPLTGQTNQPSTEYNLRELHHTVAMNDTIMHVFIFPGKWLKLVAACFEEPI